MKKMNQILLGSLFSLTVGMGTGGAPALGQETNQPPATSKNEDGPVTSNVAPPKCDLRRLSCSNTRQGR